MRALWLVILIACNRSERPPATGSASGSAAAPDPGRPASITPEIQQTLEDTMTTMRRLATELESAKRDCEAATVIMRASYPDATRLAQRSSKFNALVRDDLAAQEWIQARYKAPFEESMNKMIVVADACHDHAAFQQALTDYPLVAEQRAP